MHIQYVCRCVCDDLNTWKVFIITVNPCAAGVLSSMETMPFPLLIFRNGQVFSYIPTHLYARMLNIAIRSTTAFSILKLTLLSILILD